MRQLLVVIFCLVLVGCHNRYLPDEEISSGLPETIDYNFHVQPILSDRCYRCHGPDEQARKADLRLDTKQGLFSGSGNESNPPVRPGKLNASELFKRITSDDPELHMPPPESKLSLTEKEIAILAKWIQQGADWKPHWSFIPPERPELPPVRATGWPQNEIDYFVLKRLETEALQPASPADRETLLRRVSIDLTGLPPTIKEIDSFLSDDSPNAYEKVVDRLLESSAFGENMAISWLDLARYADTHGYQADYYRPHWPWRDWVIKAFNQNQPFDEFVTWQLAGDLIPDASRDQIIATGFNRNHPQNNEGGIVEEEFRVEYVADRTQTFGTAFLGLTLQCARCHDHKYDPVTQREFYQLFAFFNNVAESGQTTFYQPDLPGPTLLIPDEEQAAQVAYIEQLAKEKEAEIAHYRNQQFDRFNHQLTPPKVNAIEGLVAHYPLELVRNHHIPNRIQTGKPGVIIDPVFSVLSQDPPQIIPGSTGSGLKLTGDDALSFPGVGRFGRSQPFSVGIWIKTPQQLTHGVIFHSNKGSALYTYKGYQVSVENNQFDVRLAHNFPYNAIHLVTQQAVPKEQWVQLTLTYDGSSTASGTKLYVNGALQPVEVIRDNLYKDIVFHPQGDSNKSPVDTHLKVGARWRGKGFTNGMVDEIMVYNRELTALEIGLLSNTAVVETPVNTPSTEDRKMLVNYHISTNDPSYLNLQQQLQVLREKHSLIMESLPEVMVMDEMPQPRPAYILARGAYDQPLEEVKAGTPQVVMSYPEQFLPNRLGLAKWLFNPKNPLPARVTVNRFWQHYFGTGLVRTAEDFGSQGERPTHPQLLDWLASEFVNSGWDVKHMQKLIVMSSTYGQSSKVEPSLRIRDPENSLLARGPSSRLSAEALRDLALAASGLLVDKLGGPSVKPYQPEGLWSFNAFSGKYQQDHGDDLYRRSLYTFWKRTNPPPSMNIFDAPSRSYCVVKREETATPLQALVLMNDPQFLEASRVLAQRILLEGGTSVEDRLRHGYRLLTSRNPGTEELELLQNLYLEAYTKFEQNRPKALALVSIGEYPINRQIDHAELAALSEVITTLINFDATTMKR